MDFSLFTFHFSLIKRALPLMLLSCLMACNGNKQKANDTDATTTADGPVATKVINLTSLMGRWTSISRNFVIEEGGVVTSDVKAETHPYTSWKIFNGQLLLGRDTFNIVTLGPDSLAIENHNGIYLYKRQR